MSSQITCVSPINGELLATRTCLTLRELEDKIVLAKIAQKEWKTRPLSQRMKVLENFLENMRSQNSDITIELAQQMGRPIRYGGEFRSFEERMLFLLKHGKEFLEQQNAPNPIEGFKRYTSREPLGLVFVIAPWNYPYLTANNAITTALLAGNAVLFKAASQTLLTGERFQNAIDRALEQVDMPRGLFTNLYLDHHVTLELIKERKIDFVNFTGSVQVGKDIERANAGNFTRLGLELGGKDPALVWEDADLKESVVNLVDGAFYNSGQSCCGIERIYVHEKLYDAFVESFVTEVLKYKLGDPLNHEVTLGPMAHKRFADHVRSQNKDANQKGARALIDAKHFPEDTHTTAYLAPQVFINVNHNMQIMTEESFGPVVGIMKIKNEIEALNYMNDSSYGLTASIWSKDLEFAERLGRDIETGTIFLNRCDYVDAGLGWFGVKDTGLGQALGKFGFEHLTRPKNFHLRKS